MATAIWDVFKSNIHNYDNQYSDCYKFMPSLWGFFPVLFQNKAHVQYR